jgi:hypothetical protein
MIRVLLVAFSIAFFFTAQSQTTLSFCTAVEQDGYCAFYNDKFITSPDSSFGRVYLLLRNPNGVGVTHATFKIYELDKEGKETYQNSLDQTLETDWVYAWKIGFFKSPGKFRVKVENDAGEIICGKSFELFNAW